MASLPALGSHTLPLPRPPPAAPSFDAILRYSDGNAIFIWHPPYIFSQLAAFPFIIDDIICNCGEQYMMTEKSILFNDHSALQIILHTPDPRLMKQLGRCVRGFDYARCIEECFNIVLTWHILQIVVKLSVEEPPSWHRRVSSL